MRLCTEPPRASSGAHPEYVPLSGSVCSTLRRQERFRPLVRLSCDLARLNRRESDSVVVGVQTAAFWRSSIGLHSDRVFRRCLAMSGGDVAWADDTTHDVLSVSLSRIDISTATSRSSVGYSRWRLVCASTSYAASERCGIECARPLWRLRRVRPTRPRPLAQGRPPTRLGSCFDSRARSKSFRPRNMRPWS